MISRPLPHMEIKRLTRDCHLGRGSSRAASLCPIAPRTPTPPTRLTPRRPTKACSRCGARSWAASTFSCMARVGWRAGCKLRSRRWRSTPTSWRWSPSSCGRCASTKRRWRSRRCAKSGPGGHFFGAEHTQSRYRTAFFPPTISDWRNYESWREAGSPTAFDAAERIVAERLRDFTAPPLEPERLEALTAFVARRKAEGGAPTDF